jgi:PAS domain S-box-containing protein
MVSKRKKPSRHSTEQTIRKADKKVHKKPARATLPGAIQKLRTQNARLERLLKVSPSAFLISDAETGQIVEINKTGEQLLKLSLAHAVKKQVPLRSLFAHEADFESLATELSVTSSVMNRICSLKALDGAELKVQLCATGLKIGSQSCLALIFQQVRKDDGSERLLQNYYGKILNLEKALDASNLVSVTDAQGTIIYVNEKFCEVSKYSRDELLGQNHRIINSGYHSAEFMKNLWRTISSGETWSAEIKNRAKDGSIYWVNSTIVPFVDKNGKPYQFFAIRQDITQRKQSASELERSREALLLAQQLARVGSWEWYPENDRPVWSPEMFAIYGLDASEPPVPFAEVSRLFTLESWATLSPTVERAFKTGEPYELECEIVRRDGSHGWIISRGSPITDETGQILGLRGTIQDISERKRNEERNRLIINALPDLIFVLSRQGVFEDYHASEPKRLVYKPEFFIGKSFHEIFEPDLAQKMHGAITALIDGSTIERIEYTLPVGEAQQHYEATFTTLDRDRIMIVVRDTTERKLSELRLFESERNLAIAQRIAGIGSWHWQIASNKLTWSAEVYRIFGVGLEEFDGTLDGFLKMVHADDRQKIQTGIEAAFAGAPHFELEHRIVRPDGAVLIVHELGEVSFDAAGKPESIAGTVQNITQRALADQKMREQATLLDKAQDAILVRDMNHSIQYWNKGAERLYGWTQAEVMGKSVKSLLYDSAEAFDAATAEVTAHGEYSGELRQQTRDRRSLTVRVRWTLLRDDAGKPKSILAINTDVTERKSLEQQFLRAQRLESIGTLAGGIAHDLNNLLTPITLAVDLLKQDKPDSQQLELLDMIDVSARRGAGIVKQVLTFARGTDGVFVSLEPGKILSELKQMLTETLPKNITLLVRCEENAPAIQGDSTQLLQVLMNLAVNARDAMPNGGNLTIVAENRNLDQQYAGMEPGAVSGDYLLFRIEDNGVGMVPEVLEKIFDPFYTTKLPGYGTGLGLSTSISIVKAHGGFIRVYSEPSRGSRFHVYLPANSAGDIAANEHTQIETLKGGGRQILLVDDEAPVREVTKQTLEALGFRVLTAADGAEALSVFASAQDRIDLVITDMTMPTLDGLGLMRILIKMKPHLPIIAISGLDVSKTVVDLRHNPPVCALQKPFTAASLQAVIRKALI